MGVVILGPEDSRRTHVLGVTEGSLQSSEDKGRAGFPLNPPHPKPAAHPALSPELDPEPEDPVWWDP